MLTPTLLMLIIIGLIGFWGLDRVEKEVKANLVEQLQTSVKATLKGIDIWAGERTTLLEVIATDPEISHHINRLVEKSRVNPKMDSEALHQTPELPWLRAKLGRVTRQYGFTGFVLFDPTGLQVASFLEEPVGSRDLMKRSDFFQRALNGATVISVPFPSEVPLPDTHGQLRANWPTMFVATPVRNDRGKVAAVLSFRLRPETDFTGLFTVIRPGSTGETYAFNSNGTLISQSRFEPQLRAIGLLPEDLEVPSILNIGIRDPRGDMTQGFVPELSRDQQPLTLMAQHAINKKDGFNVDGYNDYRGVPVVGAWAWLEKFNFGVTHEIDVEEALAPLNTLNRIFLILFALLMSASGLGLIQYYRKTKAEEKAVLRKKESEETGRRMASIFKTIIDGIVIIDHEGIIESFNPGAEKIFGYSRQEIVGQNVNVLMPEPYHSEHNSYLKRYMEAGETIVFDQVRELIGKRKDGELIYIELSANEVTLESGIKFVGTIRDISQRKIIEQEILEAKNEAETASQAKTQFLSQMSHELRTPMNAILGFAQIMENEPGVKGNTVLEECGRQILKAGRHLLALINEILDLSQIETGKTSVSLEPVELSPLVREVLAFSKPLAKGRKITFDNQVLDSDEYVVWADRMRLQQVLLNLVSNAIKYNREGGTVTLSCRQTNKNRLSIAVTDTGQGIEEKDQSLLFEPFSRLYARHPEIEGTGIGLTIARMLMVLMNGDIAVKSALDNGSTFTLDIPLSKEPLTVATGPGPLPSRASIGKKPESEKPDNSKTVLYIEDNPANMFLIKQILDGHRPDLELRTTPRATTGLDLARELQPELILLDMGLPGMGGLDLYLHLQQSESTRNIPVVVVSANALESDIERALSLGVDEYLTKPINLRKFLAVVAKYLPKTSVSEESSSLEEKNEVLKPQSSG